MFEALLVVILVSGPRYTDYVMFVEKYENCPNHVAEVKKKLDSEVAPGTPYLIVCRKVKIAGAKDV